MLPLISFGTGRKTQTQSSVQDHSRVRDSKWKSGSIGNRNHGREANTRGEESERICTRAPPKRAGRAFALLTKTYHGSRLVGSDLRAQRGNTVNGKWRLFLFPVSSTGRQSER